MEPIKNIGLRNLLNLFKITQNLLQMYHLYPSYA